MAKNTAQSLLPVALCLVLLFGTNRQLRSQDTVYVPHLSVLRGKIVSAGTHRDTSFIAQRGTALKVVKKDSISLVFTCELDSISDIQVPFYTVDRSAPTSVSIPKAKNSSTTSSETESKPNVKVAEPKESPSNGRCSAYTKKGTQCSRSAGPSGRCWQH